MLPLSAITNRFKGYPIQALSAIALAGLGLVLVSHSAMVGPIMVPYDIRYPSSLSNVTTQAYGLQLLITGPSVSIIAIDPMIVF